MLQDTYQTVAFGKISLYVLHPSTHNQPTFVSVTAMTLLVGLFVVRRNRSEMTYFVSWWDAKLTQWQIQKF